MNFARIAHNLNYAASMVLFLMGLYAVSVKANLIKKIMGLNIMETAVFLFLVSTGMVDKGYAPIAMSGVEPSKMVNPLPQALILTGIVVAVSTTAVALALCMKIHEKYRTLDAFRILGREEL